MKLNVERQNWNTKSTSKGIKSKTNIDHKIEDQNQYKYKLSRHI
jgi:hypothetical protein